MPYAEKDRQEFIKRSALNPDARILDFGGTLSNELPSAVTGIAAKKPIANAILIKPELLPFKNSVFRAVISYHYFDLISSEKLVYVFEDVARILDKDSILSFMILNWTAQNEAQKSSLLFSRLLKSAGTLFQHEFEKISMQLSSCGFGEITVETVKREIPIPMEFFRAHIGMIGNLVKIEKAQGGTEIRTLAKQYYHHVNDHGEAMLPALHFTARKP